MSVKYTASEGKPNSFQILVLPHNHKGRHLSTYGLHPSYSLFLKIKLYWNMATRACLHTIYCHYLLRRQG